MAGETQRAGAVLLAYLSDQVDTIRVMESRVGSIDQDAIHKTRVATRRLRSVLSSYRRLLRREQTEPLRDELRWLAMVLGSVRDIHILREQLRVEASDLASLGALPRSAEKELERREQEAARELHAALDSVRYGDLRGRLDALVDQPPLRRRADRSAATVLPPLVGRAARAVDDAATMVDAAVSAPDEPSTQMRDERLHEVRKAAKRARYAAEVALPVGGKGARLLVERMTHLQEVLGQHQDSVMSRRVLEEMSHAPARGRVRAGEDAFAVGLLAGHEESQDASTLDAYHSAVVSAAKGKVRRWTLVDGTPGQATAAAEDDGQATR